MNGTRKRNLEICVRCKCFQLRSLDDDIRGPFQKDLPLDEPSYGNNRYFRCTLDNEFDIHLEAHLLENDRKAKWKYERRELSKWCPMMVEQKMSEWNQ